MTLTLFFKQPPFLGKNLVLTTLLFFAALAILALALHSLSSTLVRIIQTQLSSGMNQVLAGRGRSRGIGQILDSVLENTPAIRGLRSELKEKRRLASENSAFQSEVSNLLEEHSKQESKAKTTTEIVSQVRHDLRSPLSYLKVFGQSLYGDKTETYHLSVQRRYLRKLWMAPQEAAAS